jgi:hypothetical protein
MCSLSSEFYVIAGWAASLDRPCQGFSRFSTAAVCFSAPSRMISRALRRVFIVTHDPQARSQHTGAKLGADGPAIGGLQNCRGRQHLLSAVDRYRTRAAIAKCFCGTQIPHHRGGGAGSAYHRGFLRVSWRGLRSTHPYTHPRVAGCTALGGPNLRKTGPLARAS